MLRKKLGSSCLASICACNLSMQLDWAVRNCTKIGTEHLYMEMGIGTRPFLTILRSGVSGGPNLSELWRRLKVSIPFHIQQGRDIDPAADPPTSQSEQGAA